MAKRDGAGTRKERINKIAVDIQAAFYKKKECGELEELQLSKFIGLEMFDTGLTNAKIKEYLEIVQMKGQCELDFENDKIRKPLV